MAALKRAFMSVTELDSTQQEVGFPRIKNKRRPPNRERRLVVYSKRGSALVFYAGIMQAYCLRYHVLHLFNVNGLLKPVVER